MPPDRPRFAVDEMLGTLARWLRVMGYDAVYEKDHNDDEIVDIAKREGRILLTRDRELAARMERGDCTSSPTDWRSSCGRFGKHSA